MKIVFYFLKALPVAYLPCTTIGDEWVLRSNSIKRDLNSKFLRNSINSMKYHFSKLVLILASLLFLSCNKKNSITSSYQIKRRSSVKESFKIDDKFQERAKTNVSTRKKKHANYSNNLIEQRKRETALQDEERKKKPQYNNPAFFGEKKNPRKKNGKIWKKFAKPPYVMNPALNKPKNNKPKNNKSKKRKQL